MKFKVVHCLAAQREHNRSIRQYAHTWHDVKPPGTICVAHEFFFLPDSFLAGILAHEVGHLIAGPAAGERGADLAAQEWLGTRIKYRDSRHGRRLEWITKPEMRRLFKIVSFST